MPLMALKKYVFPGLGTIQLLQGLILAKIFNYD